MSSDETPKFPKGQSAMRSLANAASAAAKLVAAKAEQTKLTTLTLPAAYRELGKDCVLSKRHLEGNESLTTQLQSVLAESKALKDAAANQPAGKSLTDKAKAAGKQAADVARQKSLSMKRDSLLVDLGKAIFEQQSDQSGPEQVVKPIHEALARLADLEEQVTSLSAVGSGSWITPKRLIVAAVGVVVLFGVVGWWKKETGVSSSQVTTSQPTTADDENVLATIPSNGSTDNKPDDLRQAKATTDTTFTADQKQAIVRIQELGGEVFVASSQGQTQVAVSLMSHRVKGPDLKYLSTLSPLLTELWLTNASITDFSLLEPLSNLRVLYMCRLTTGDSFVPVARLPKLESLSLHWVKQRNSAKQGNEDAALIAALTSCRSLRHLHIKDMPPKPFSSKRKDVNQFEWIAQLKDQLVFLQVSSNTVGLSPVEMQSISACERLETLVFENYDAANPSKILNGLEMLNSCQSLKTLSFKAVDDELVNKALQIPTLTTLHAVHCSLSDSLWIALDKNPKPGLKLLLPRSHEVSSGTRITEWWHQYVPKTHKLTPLPKLAELGQRNNASQVDDSLPALDMNERYDALVFRIRLGMSRTQVEDILGVPDDSVENDLGDFNPQKAGQTLEICTWRGATDEEGFIMLSFVNGKLQDGGTQGFDVGRGFKMKVPPDMDPQKRAKLEKAMKTFGVRIVDE